MKRAGELEDMLSAVAPTDFDDVPTNSVAQGTGVVISYENGTQEKFYILGEWDRDEDLGIISSESRMAQTLIGGVAGDEVVLTTAESKEVNAVIHEITPLSDDVREWINQIKE